MDFKVGQEVFSTRSGYRNLKIIEIKDKLNIECSCEAYHEGVKNHPNGWSEGTMTFSYFQLRSTPFPEAESKYVRCKWYDIINRTPNMATRILRIYENVIRGKVNLSPSYQRGLVWTLTQKRAFIENLFLEKAHITPTMILNWEDGHYEVVDGKQRLSTVFEFIEGEFDLEDGTRFSDLSKKDASFIINHEVRYTRVECHGNTDMTKEQKIELFLEINELGTKMSEEHIENVKKMLEE